MPIVDLPQGRIHYRVAGPESGDHPPVVFVHGLLVNAELWSGVARALAERGIRSYAPDLPLGAHPTPLAEGADRSPRGLAQLLLDFLAAHDLTDVTLVGNDTGGALCQFAVDTDASRIARLVLTNCDAFDKFPPAPFGALVRLGRRPGRLRLAMKAAGARPMRHSVLGYGGLVSKPLDPEVTANWVRPMVADPAIATDVARFFAAMDKRELAAVGERLDRFSKPVLLLWGDADPFFKIRFAERLAATFPDTRLIRIEGGRTFVPLDFPERVADEIAAFLQVPA